MNERGCSITSQGLGLGLVSAASRARWSRDEGALRLRLQGGVKGSGLALGFWLGLGSGLGKGSGSGQPRLQDGTHPLSASSVVPPLDPPTRTAA